MWRKIAIVVVILFATTISLYCSEIKTEFSLEGDPLETIGKKFALQAGIGAVNYKNTLTGESESLPKLQLQPTLRLEPISCGLDIELLLASKDKRKIIQDSGKNPVIVRFVEYSKDPVFARWGVLERVTLGRGLIMNNYSSTTSAKSSVFTNKDKGIKISYKGDEYDVTAISTYSHVWGVRGQYKISPKLIVGGTVVVDGDDKDDVSAYGIDLTVPIINKVDFYSEVATLKLGDKSKSGFTSGVYFNVIENRLTWKNEFRNFSNGFIPGYFDSHYESASLSRIVAPTFVQTDSKNGFLSRIDVVPADKIKMFAAYEKYKKYEPRLVAETIFDLSDIVSGEKSPTSIKGIISYQQENFRLKVNPQSAIVKGTVFVGLQKNIDLVVDYLKTYDLTQDKPITSTTYNIKYKF